AVGAAAVLAETGDPRRYDSSSSLDGHAGLSPSGNASGAFEGQAHISRRGRPGLRLTVWRAIWPLLIHDSVMAAKYAAMIAAAGAAAAAQAAQAPSGTGFTAGQRGGRGPGAAREGPGRVRRLAAALDLLHSRLRHRLGSRPRLRRRQPARPPPPGGGRMGSASRPAPAPVP
ncbi:MAG TPA: transposase, partial [Streptosporangiaceae bacterium]|nr:transposase [Streptosporangiaceae bacterium]